MFKAPAQFISTFYLFLKFIKGNLKITLEMKPTEPKKAFMVRREAWVENQ